MTVIRAVIIILLVQIAACGESPEHASSTALESKSNQDSRAPVTTASRTLYASSTVIQPNTSIHIQIIEKSSSFLQKRCVPLQSLDQFVWSISDQKGIIRAGEDNSSMIFEAPPNEGLYVIKASDSKSPPLTISIGVSNKMTSQFSTFPC